MLADRQLVLHTLRCIGSTSAERIAGVCGLGGETVESELIDLAVDGLVGYEGGGYGGWSLTVAGQAADAAALTAELEDLGVREVVHAAHQRFEGLNAPVMQACSDWQLKRGVGGAVVNDHDDREYDDAVLARLATLDDRAQRLCASLGEAMQHFGRYGPRLGEAIDRALAGDVSYVADHVDGYHAVWFQLHEDLLATLGLPRTW